MLLLLPTFQARLLPCPVSAAALTPHARGQFCSQCQRVVQDFSQSTNPVADLAAARAASPDGRVCGSFAVAQVQRPRLTQRLRWFVVALVLVVSQGLTAREALAQVRRAATLPQLTMPVQQATILPPEEETSNKLYDSDTRQAYTGYVEQMPNFQGSSFQGVVPYIQQRTKWPQQNGKIVRIEGKVFVSFKVGIDGKVHDVAVVKGLHPLFDTEVLRVVRELPDFEPGQQNHLPVETEVTVPVTFKLQ
jgi:protein TonB